MFYEVTPVVVAGSSGFTGFGNAPSQNDYGDVAFVGQSTAGESIEVYLNRKGQGGEFRQISGPPRTDLRFGPAVSINNTGAVLARTQRSGTHTATFTQRVYSSLRPGDFQTLATGGIELNPYNRPIDDYSAIFSFGALNDNVSGVTLGNLTNNVVIAGLTSYGGMLLDQYPVDRPFGDVTFESGTSLRPALTADGRVLAKGGKEADSPLQLWPAGLSGPPVPIAHTGMGYATIGRAADITSDGRIAVYTADGALYASVEQQGPQGLVRRTVELLKSPHYVLDPNDRVAVNSTHRDEPLIDANRNGAWDPGESYTDLNQNNRHDPGQRAVTVAFLATRQGQKGLYTLRLNLYGRGTRYDENNVDLVAGPPTLVARQGDVLADVGQIAELNFLDGLNNRDRGELAFWVQSSSGQQAIVQARSREVIYLDFDPTVTFGDSDFGSLMFEDEFGTEDGWEGGLEHSLQTLAPHRTDLSFQQIVQAVSGELQSLLTETGSRALVLNSLDLPSPPEDGRYLHVFVGQGPDVRNLPLGIASSVDLFNQDLLHIEQPVGSDQQIIRTVGTDTVLVFANEALSSSLLVNSAGEQVQLDHSPNQSGTCPAAAGLSCISQNDVAYILLDVIAHEVGHALGLLHLDTRLNHLAMNAEADGDNEPRRPKWFATSPAPLAGTDDLPDGWETQNDRERLVFAAGSSDPDLRRAPPSTAARKLLQRDRFRLSATGVPDTLTVAKAVVGIVPLGEEHLLPQIYDLGSGLLSELLNSEIPARDGDKIVLLASTQGTGVDVFAVAPHIDPASISLDSLLALMAGQDLRGEIPAEPASLQLVQRQAGGHHEVVGSVAVQPVLARPDAVDDAASTDEDHSTIIDLLANDLPGDTTIGPGAIEIWRAPRYGALEISSNGQATYTPDPDYHGPDEFYYAIGSTQGAWSSPARVALTVAAVNDPPLVLDDELRIDEGQAVVVSVLHNDHDADGIVDPSSLRIEQQAEHGIATVTPEGLVQYVPAAGYRGMDTFQYSVADQDGARSPAATVSIEVRTNLPPVASNDVFQAVSGTTISVEPLGNDFDPDGQLDKFSLTVVSPPGVGSLQVLAGGILRYTSPGWFEGQVTAEYLVADAEGQNSAPATLEFRVSQPAAAMVVLLEDGPWTPGSPLEFGPLAQLSTSATGTVVLRNTGTAELEILDVSVTGTGFSTSEATHQRVGPGGQTAVFVTLSDAAAEANALGTLTIRTNAANAAELQIPLRGAVDALPFEAFPGVGSWSAASGLVESSVTVPETTALGNVAVLMEFTPSRGAYHSVSLQAPDGSQVWLGTVTNHDHENPQRVRLLWSDGALRPVPSYPYEPLQGRFRPWQAIHDTLGDSVTPGTWTLTADAMMPEDSFRWWLIPNGAAPDITLVDVPNRRVLPGDLVTVDLQSGSASQHAMVYELEQGAARGALLDPVTGQLRWAPDESDTGHHEFIVRARATELQWATQLVGASSGGDSAVGALGIPDGWGWTPDLSEAGRHTLTVSFDQPVRAAGMVVVENGSNGFVRGVEVLDPDGNWLPVWAGVDTTVPNRWAAFTAGWTPTTFPVSTLRLMIEHAETGYEVLDALGLVGLVEDARDATTTIEVEVAERPAILGVTPGDGASLEMLQKLTVSFSRPMSAPAVEDVRHYVLRDSTGQRIPFSSATYQENGPTYEVLLQVDSRAPLRPGTFSLAVDPHALIDRTGVPLESARVFVDVVVPRDKQAVRLGVDGDTAQWKAVSTSFRYGFDEPEHVEAADLNGDGRPDLVATSPSDRGVVIYMADDQGSFAPGRLLPSLGLPVDVLLADWNLDSYPDIVVPTNIWSDGDREGYTIWLNDGHGEFHEDPDSPLPFAPTPLGDVVAVADVLGDAHPEIIQARYRGGREYVVEIIGRDRFLGYNVLAELLPGAGREESSPSQLFVEDFNGDGRLDVLTNNFEFGTDGYVLLFENSATGYRPARELEMERYRGVLLEVGDFDSDGKPDLLVMEDRFSINSGFFDAALIHFLKGTGTGHFVQAPYQAMGGRGPALQRPVDVNRDGKLDLVFLVAPYESENYGYLSLTDENAIWIWLGQGNGTFQPSTAEPVPLAGSEQYLPNRLTFRDLNGDGWVDAVGNDVFAREIRTLKNDRQGRLLPANDVRISGGPRPNVDPFSRWLTLEEPVVQTVDLNHDGLDDLVALGGVTSKATIDVLFGSPGGGFVAGKSFALPTSAAWLESTDWNQDGHVDLLVGDGGNAIYRLEGRNGDFRLLEEPLPPVPSDVGDWVMDGSAADVNLDGIPDLVVSLRVIKCRPDCYHGVGVAVYFGLGDGQYSFNRNTLTREYGHSQLLLQDVNSDLIPDLVGYETADVSSGAGGLIHMLPGRGNGQFGAPIVTEIPEEEYLLKAPEFLRLSDINGDGYVDLLGVGYGHIGLFAGDGQGHFTLAEEQLRDVPGSSPVTCLEAGDFDGDGDNDVIVGFHTGSTFLSISTAVLYANHLGRLDGGREIEVGGPPVGAGQFLLTQSQAAREIGTFTLASSLPEPTLPSTQLDPQAPVLQGTSAPYARVSIETDGAVLGVVWADADGNWSVAVPSSLAAGFHQLTITSHSPQGQVSEPLTVEIELPAADNRFTWTNPRDPLDVNDDSFVTPRDALLLINYLNTEGSHVLEEPQTKPEFYIDTNADGRITPLDALLVVNHLNLGGNGE